MEAVPGQAITQPALSDPSRVINPHEAVEYMSSVIEEEFQKSEKPRDETGKFTKAETKTEEAKPEKEAPKEEVKAEEAKPEEEQPEPEPRRFKLKYKGEELEKDESEVLTLAQQGFDYTQKTQELAKQREELPVRIKTEVEARTKAYEQQLETYKQAVLKMADPDVVNADLNKLSMEDPARALQLMVKRQHLQQALHGIATEQARIAQQRDTEATQAKQKEISESLEVIQRDIPGWSGELYGKLLKTATDFGYTKEEANAITDPKVVKLLNEARQWREYKSAKPTVDKRVAAIPKVVKPGSAEKPAQSDRVKEGMDKLSKSGSRDDAVSVVEEMLRLGKI